MFKLIIISVLCISALGYDHCWKNIGNLRSTEDPILSVKNATISLEDCKNYCDQWETLCSTLEGSTESCSAVPCMGGSLVDEGCDLYQSQDDDDWELYSDISRDQGFVLCDPECWIEYNGQEHMAQDQVLEMHSGNYSIADCQAFCIALNQGCEAQGCVDWCGGVTSQDEVCILTKKFDPEHGLQFSNEHNSHYREYTCEINNNPEPEYASIHIDFPEQSSEDEASGDEQTDADDDSDEPAGSGVCNQAIVYSECGYKGNSAVVNLVVNELTWEPKSWCVPEYQTLILHNAFNLQGESASYEESVECADIVTYSLLSLNKLKKKAAAPTHSARTV